MSKKQRKFADDGWAVWIDGEDTSTIHINDWLNPKGKSYVDIAIHIRGIKLCKLLNVYVPFPVSVEEIDDVSLSFENTKILQAIFSAACIVDYKKNQHASEIAYNGKTVDIVHAPAFVDWCHRRRSLQCGSGFFCFVYIEGCLNEINDSGITELFSCTGYLSGR